MTDIVASADTPLAVPSKNRFLGLEFGRGVAASLVAMHHASNLLDQVRYGGTAPFGDFMRGFDVGVDFFFVLSGFIITWVHSKDIGRPERLWTYLTRRFTRIYPPYWCVLIPLAIMYFLFPNAGKPSDHDPVNVLISFFLLPNVDMPVLGVAWTLVYEVFFYVIFALVLVIGPRGWFLVLFWVAGIVAFYLFGNQLEWPQNFFFNGCNLEFIIGIVVARSLAATRVRFPGAFLVGGLMIFSAVTVFRSAHLDDFTPIYGYLLLGGSAGAIIIGGVELERSGRLALGRIATLFGSASYSIYLVHSVVESWALVLTWRYLRWLPTELAWGLLVALGIVAGLIFHHFVERSVIDIVRRSLRPAAAEPSPGT